MPIDEVRPGDLVWDGEEWVHTDGPIYQGMKEVINVEGEYCTPEHKVWTEEGWVEAQRLGSIHESAICRPLRVSASWADVWSMVRRIFGRGDKGKI